MYKSMPNLIHHLAIPCADLEAAKQFYEALGCRIARQYDDRITVDFFGMQLVCHLSPNSIDQKPNMYPRHFGITFREKSSFEKTLNFARNMNLSFFVEPFTRFATKREEHSSFFLIDPSNNLIEFKFYSDPEMMF